MKRGKAMTRSRMAKKPPPQGFPEAVRVAVRLRSGGRCEAELRTCTGVAQHFHHRKLRRFKDHSAANCLHVCSADHDHIHANPTKSYLMGHLLHEWQDPATTPVKRGSNHQP